VDAVYLDHAATTPVREEVRAAMEPYASVDFGNPSSLHSWGRAAEAALENARAEVASALGAKASEIRFVRGGTESDNLAIIGSARALTSPGIVPTVVVSAVEHSAVREAAAHLLTTREANVITVSVSPTGELDLDTLGSAIERDTSIVSVMWVNNETGMVLPIREAGTIARDRGATMHTDASQAIGKLPVHLGEVPIDLLTATGHKINGPKGMGILFIRTGTRVRPMVYGGGQERALRPGTQDVAGAVGFATALRLAVDEQVAECARLQTLRVSLEDGLAAAVPDLRVNAARASRAPHVSSIGVGGVDDGEVLLMALDLEGVAVSGGSACLSGAGKRSHVMEALYGPDDPFATVRFSFGHGTAPEDIEQAVAAMSTAVRRLRAAS